MLNIQQFLTEKYHNHPVGSDLGTGTSTRFKLLDQKEKKAVVNMTITDSAGRTLDTYLFFEKDSIWKLDAFRALAMVGIIEQAIQELEAMTAAQIDEQIRKSRQNPADPAIMFRSKEEYDFELGNAKLTLAPDDSIVNYFLVHHAEFERIKNLALRQVEKLNMEEEKSYNLLENLQPDYRKVLISHISTHDADLGDGIIFSIGGMVDNTVGYLYIANEKDLPVMHPDGVIMIRAIGNGWYMYKTT